MSAAALVAPPSASRAARWLMWSAPTFVFLVAFVHRPAPGVIAKELMQSFAAGGTMVGLLSATYFYTYAGLMIPAGICIDTWGVRRMVSLGAALMTAGALAMALATTMPVLFAGRLAVGAGATVTFVGALKVAGTWFPPTEFGVMAALTATAGALGALLATAPFAWLVVLVGWRGAITTLGVLTCVGGALTYAIVREQEPGTRPPGVGEVIAGMGEVLRNRHTWPPFFAFFFYYAALGNLMLWAIPYLRDAYGLAAPDAAFYAGATALALLASGPSMGWLSDRLGRRQMPYLVGITGVAVAWAVFTLTLGRLPLGGVAVVLFAIGTFGGCFVLVWPIGREVNPPRLAGVAVAVVNFGGFLGAAVTQGPLGALLDARWDGVMAAGARVYPLAAYRLAFAVCTAFVVASGISALFLRERARG